MLTAPSQIEVVADVPPSIFHSPPYLSRQQRWKQSYNIAAWIRFQSPTLERVRLLVRIEDTNGKRDILVDQANILNPVVLLSSRISLSLVGPLRSMKIMLQSPTPMLKADELLVQPVKGSLTSGKVVEIEPGHLARANS